MFIQYPCLILNLSYQDSQILQGGIYCAGDAGIKIGPKKQPIQMPAPNEMQLAQFVPPESLAAKVTLAFQQV